MTAQPSDPVTVYVVSTQHEGPEAVFTDAATARRCAAEIEAEGVWALVLDRWPS